MLQRNTIPVEGDGHNISSEEELDPRVLSSVMISVKMSQIAADPNASADPHTRLLELMQSDGIKALMSAAMLHAQRSGIAPHIALQQIVLSLKEIDDLWTKVLLKEGLAVLSAQYH